MFLREIKTDNISVNASLLIQSIVDLDIDLLLVKKNMFYLNPLIDGKEENDLKRQLFESQSLANKYMNIFKKSFFSRLFSGLRKKDIENDKKMLS